MQPYRHHPGGVFALCIKHVKRISKITVELIAAVEALRRGKAHVVVVQRIGHHQMRLAVNLSPERQIIVVVISVVKKSALFHNQRSGTLTGSAGIPAQWPLAGQTANNLNGPFQVLTLDIFRNIAVINPAVTVRADFMACRHCGLCHGRVAFERHGHAENREGNLITRKKIQKTPYPDPRTILIDRLHAGMTLPRPRCGADDF